MRVRIVRRIAVAAIAALVLGLLIQAVTSQGVDAAVVNGAVVEGEDRANQRLPGAPVEGSWIVVLESPPPGAGADFAADTGTADTDAAVSNASLVRRLVSETGVSTTARYQHLFAGFAANLTDADAAALADNRLVKSVEPDRYIELPKVDASAHAAGPTDMTDDGTIVPWGLDRIDQRGRYLDGRYHYEATGAGVDIYVVDSGVRYSHREFGGRVVGGYNAFGGPWYQDCDGHGTHVASTAAGSNFGVAKQANIWSVRVFDCFGVGTQSSLLEGLEWIARNASGPSVVNLSLGKRNRDPAYNRAVAGLLDQRITVVAAAGNGSTDACGEKFPEISGVISVAALTRGDERAGFSNWGPCVDLFAPGTAILGAGAASDRAVRSLQGTSMATPHVAGAVALYLESFPEATAAAVSDALLDGATTTPVGSAAGSPQRVLHTYTTGTLAPVQVPPQTVAIGTVEAPYGIPESSGGAADLVHLRFDRPIVEDFRLAWNVVGGSSDARDLRRTEGETVVRPRDLDYQNRLALDLFAPADGLAEGPETVVVSVRVQGRGVALADNLVELTIVDSDDRPAGQRRVLDDFEVDRGWDLSSPIAPATAGAFEIADPERSPAYNGVVYQPGSVISGTRALVTGGAPVGVNFAGYLHDVDDGQAWARRQVAVPDGAHTLEISSYFAHSSSARWVDFLRISVDGNLILLERGPTDNVAGQVRPPAWDKIRIDARSLAGRTVDFEIIASDGVEADDNGRRRYAVVEAAIDDIVVWVGGDLITPRRGDVNCSGDVDIVDADLLWNYARNLWQTAAFAQCVGTHPSVADLNGDGRVNLWDAVAFRYCIRGNVTFCQDLQIGSVIDRTLPLGPQD